MLSKFLKRDKPTLYIGEIFVAPRKDLMRHIDQWGFFKRENIESGMQQSLLNLFSFPSIEERNTNNKKDMALDVIVSKHQLGDCLIPDGDIFIPIFWRPQVKILSRIYYLSSGETKTFITITEKMKWFDFIKRIIAYQFSFKMTPAFHQKDMDVLLYRGCLKILKKIKKQI
jgi:hypothetical protein